MNHDGRTPRATRFSRLTALSLATFNRLAYLAFSLVGMRLRSLYYLRKALPEIRRRVNR